MGHTHCRGPCEDQTKSQGTLNAILIYKCNQNI